MEEENLDQLIEAYSSESDIQSAIEEKNAGEFEAEQSIGEMLKDYPAVQRELDLHQKTGSEAQSEISHFINSCSTQGLRTVRIITGKGLHSKNQQSILPQVTEQKLSQLKKEGLVLNFKREKTGGSVVVYLI
ncbi:Smr/MutS family protein [Patescibacteria group bacterium]|nr:Smr/MutS family protein [Patescibacteria group bacterium]MBU1682508.1 Smr/MutS family protein [Patescibacteria group bacterium]MBU1934666.1 Smr/MutS family protein [Patescibacteria group bacterium]